MLKIEKMENVSQDLLATLFEGAQTTGTENGAPDEQAAPPPTPAATNFMDIPDMAGGGSYTIDRGDGETTAQGSENPVKETPEKKAAVLPPLEPAKKSVQQVQNGSAEGLTKVLDILLCRICGAIEGPGSDRDKYRMDREDKEDFKALFDILQTGENWLPDPLTIAKIMAVLYVGERIVSSYEARRKRKNGTVEPTEQRSKKMEREQEEFETFELRKPTYDLFNPPPQPEEPQRKEVERTAAGQIMKVFNEAPEVGDGRRKFETDNNGFYTHDEENRYIKAPDRRKKPSLAVLQLKRQGLKNIEIRKKLLNGQ